MNQINPKSLSCSILLLLIFSLLVFLQTNAQSKDTTSARQPAPIHFEVQQGDTAFITIYNILAVIRQFVARPGRYKLEISRYHLPPGIYVVSIKTLYDYIVKRSVVLP
jgi:hypothetical protein